MSILALVPGASTAARRRLTTVGLALTLMVGLGAAPVQRAVAGGMGCTVDPDWGTLKTTWAEEVVALTNAHRATLGLRALTLSDSLTKAAEWKAAHMANFKYMSHDDPAPPVDRSWDDRIEDCGYTAGMGENIAYGYRSPAAVVAGWLGSTGHRENIENPDYRVMGMGAAATGDGVVYWAQTFGTRLEAADVQEETTAVEEQPAVTGDARGTTDRSTTTETRWSRLRGWSTWGRLSFCSTRGWCS